MSTTNLDERNLSGVAVGGQVHEDLLDQIWDLSPLDLPFQDMIGRTTSSNHLKEWVRENLEAADPDNAAIDGADFGPDESVTGERIGNYHQQSTKSLKVSDRARSVNNVGSRDELMRQVSKRQRALRRDVEARLTSARAAVAGSTDGDNNATGASECAGVGAWIGSGAWAEKVANTVRGAAGADPVLSGAGGIGGQPTTAPVPGTAAALSEANIKAAMRGAYENGGDIQYAMGRPTVIELFSDFLFTSSARVATLQSNAPQGNRQGNDAGNGSAGGGVTAQGAVNVYVSNFATVVLTPNRFQPVVAADVSDLYFIDPDLWELSFLRNYYMKELATTGLAENRGLAVDYTLISYNEEGNAAVCDIDETAAMTP